MLYKTVVWASPVYGWVLRAERVWVETFTGLQVTHFAGLLKVVRERGGNGTLLGRPWSLPLAERVLMVAVYYRTNLTMRQLGPPFGVSCRPCAGWSRSWARCSRSSPSPAQLMPQTCCGSWTVAPVRDRQRRRIQP